MRTIEKSEYVKLLKKSDQYLAAGDGALKVKAYDAAIANYCIGIINCLDSISVNRFGKDLSSDNHEAAPVVLQKRLSGAGFQGFKALAAECIAVLRMKNVASYRSESLDAAQARQARDTAKKARAFAKEFLN